MRIRSLLLFALALTSPSLIGCDDGETLAPDMASPDAGPAVGRDMRTEAGPPDMAPQPLGPDIDITPGQLNLIADPGGEPGQGMLTVANVGDADLTVDGIRLHDSPDFALVDVSDGLPIVLAPGEMFAIGVTFAPEGPGDRQGAVVITSDDPDEAERTVPLAGRNGESCIRAMPSSVNLGSVAVGEQSARFRVQIVNCGDRTAQIGEITLDGAEGFSWEVVQGMGSGQTLRSGNVLILEIGYENAVLGADDMANTALRVPNDLTPGDLRINVSVRGGGGPTCNLVLEPEQVDYETLRLGATRPVELTAINRGTAHCELRGLAVQPAAGPAENTFQIVRGLEGDRIEGGAQQTIEVAYAPVVADPIGDRADLRLSFYDPHRVQNRTATVLLRGIGAEAQIGPNPAAVQTGLTTVGCVSWRRSVDVSNVGFVPICVTGFRYEGDDCERFVPVDEPDIPEGECAPLLRGEAVVFSFQHDPDGVGEDGCTLIVESDAQNTQALAIPLAGAGRDTADTVDEAEVGDLNGLRDAYFPLSRPCGSETLRLFVNDDESDRFDFSAQRNALVFEARRHPADEGDMIRMEYEARCFQLGD